jgi:hypothetical protein
MGLITSQPPPLQDKPPITTLIYCKWSIFDMEKYNRPTTRPTTSS